jgi:sugar-phosphatase
MPLPKVIVPVDEIRNSKPDPEGFLQAAKQLGVAPKDCIVFEDTRPGIALTPKHVESTCI